MKTIFSVSLIVLFILLASPENTQALGTYDTFNGTKLNVKKWDPEGTGSGSLDIRREVAAGRAQLRGKFYGNAISNVGRGFGRSSLRFPESVEALITRIKARVQIKTAKVTKCANNDDISGRILAPRIMGFWFNDGTCAVPPCTQANDDPDFTGDMFASIEVRRQTNYTDAAGVVRIFAQVFHCNADPDCNDGTTIAFTEIGRPTIPTPKLLNLRLFIRWNEAGNAFVFQLNGDPQVTIPYSPALNAGPPGGGFFKRVELRGQAQNCDLTPPGPPNRPVAQGDIRIKEIEVNDSALP